MIALAALAAGGVAWVLVRPGGVGLARLVVEPPGRRRASPSWVTVGVAALLAVVVLAGVLGGPALGAVALAVGCVVACGGLLGLRAATRRGRAAAADEVAWGAEALAGSLRAGQVPATALVAAAAEVPVLREAADALRLGGDVAGALRRSGARPGCEGLVDLADAWAVAERTGASLAAAVAAAAGELAAQREVRRTVAAELASPRATGRLMALLPLVGLLLGFGFGGNPLTFLVGGPTGWACLVLGTGLVCAGVVWLDVLADRAGGP